MAFTANWEWEEEAETGQLEILVQPTEEETEWVEIIIEEVAA